MISFGIYCQQSFQWPFTSISIRCLMISLHISGLLAYNFYTSLSVSTIVDSKFVSNINNIHDLVNNRIPLGVTNTIIRRHLIKVLKQIA